jgi:solute carrier family 25 folate transporter 32
MSGSAKLLASGLTYPYQVVRSRMQVSTPALSIARHSAAMQNEVALSKAQHAALPEHTAKPYRSIPDCIVRTYRGEGIRAFYNGLGASALRVLPGTCGESSVLGECANSKCLFY